MMEIVDELDDWEMTQDGFGGGYPPSSSSSAPAATEAAPAAPVEVDGEGEDEDEAAGHAATGSEEGDATTRGEELEEEGEGGVGHGHGGHDHLSPLVALPGRHNKRGAAAAALALGGGATPTAGEQHKQQQQGQQGQGGQGGGRARKKSRPSIETGGVDGVAASLRQLAPLVAPAHAAAAAGLAPPPAPPSVRRGVSSGRKAPRRFDCNLYGPIAMDGLCLEIIDTPQFQRLGYISQLGACPLVYRGATHTRLQHSLGVAHLAETFVRTLVRNQPELLARGPERVLDKDILCVKVAGLCHDLGHGPFSHAFEFLIERIAAREGDVPGRAYLREWKHEDMSLRLLDALIQENGIDLGKYDLDDQDLVFIRECIVGTAPADRKGGRTGPRAFLYDIVNNARSGLDVDKLDYFKRDARNCAVDITPGWERMMEEARVAPAEPLPGHDDPQGPALPYQIVFKRRHLGSALTWFSTRYKLHAHVYQNKVVKEVELMLSDILLRAEPHLLIPGRRDEATGEVLEFFRISETLDHARAPGNLTAYCNLTDSLLDRIMCDPSPALQPSRRLIQRLRRRDLFTSVGAVTLQPAFERSLLSSASSVTEAPDDAGAAGAHALVERVHQEIVGRFRRLLDEANSTSSPPCDPHHSHGGGGGATSAHTTPAAGGGSQHHHQPNGHHQHPFPPPPPPPLDAEAALDLVHVERTVLHYGKGERNPVLAMRFLDLPNRHGRGGRGGGDGGGGGQNGGSTRVGRQVDEDQLEPCLLPQAFWSRKLRVFCKRREYRDLVGRAFLEWCRKVKQEPQEELGAGEEEDDEEENGGGNDL